MGFTTLLFKCLIVYNEVLKSDVRFCNFFCIFWRTDKQMADGQTDRRQTDRQADRQSGGPTDRKTDRQLDRQRYNSS